MSLIPVPLNRPTWQTKLFSFNRLVQCTAFIKKRTKQKKITIHRSLNNNLDFSNPISVLKNALQRNLFKNAAHQQAT